MKKPNIFEVMGLILILALTAAAGISCSSTDNIAVLESSTWVLQSYGYPEKLTKTIADKEITLVFDKAKNAVSGHSGVNEYGGYYAVDGSKLTVTGMMQTLRAGPEKLMVQESNYIRILEAAKSFKINEKQLTITGAEGTLVLLQK
jgi:heat shock protein HslJ